VSRLRIAAPGEGQPEGGFADAANAAMARALADGAVVIFLAYETPAGEAKWIAVPLSGVLARGFVDALYDQFHPDPTGE
jgi:hypothetical protein